jgi:hypothetical protein
MKTFGRIFNVYLNKDSQDKNFSVIVYAKFSSKFPCQEIERKINGNDLLKTIGQATIDLAIAQRACPASTKVKFVKREVSITKVAISLPKTIDIIGESQEEDPILAVAIATQKAICDM